MIFLEIFIPLLSVIIGASASKHSGLGDYDPGVNPLLWAPPVVQAACLVKDIASGKELLNNVCRCGKDAVPCDVGPIAVGDLELTYCNKLTDQTVDSLLVMNFACKSTDPACGPGKICDIGPITYNNSQHYLCLTPTTPPNFISGLVCSPYDSEVDPSRDNEAFTPPQQPQKPSGSTQRPQIPTGIPEKPHIPNGQPEQPQRPSGKPQQPQSSNGQPEQPQSPNGQPEQPPSPKGQPEQPQSPNGQPEQPQIPNGQPEQPQIPSSRPEQPQIPNRQPQQPQLPDEQPQQPKIPNRQPQPPRIPNRQPQQPRIPSRQPQQPQLPSEQPERPQIPNSPKERFEPRVSASEGPREHRGFHMMPIGSAPGFSGSPRPGWMARGQNPPPERGDPGRRRIGQSPMPRHGPHHGPPRRRAPRRMPHPAPRPIPRTAHRGHMGPHHGQ